MDSRTEVVAQSIAKIRETLAYADHIVDLWETGNTDDKEVVESNVEHAFIQTELLLEYLGLQQALTDVLALQKVAKKDYSSVKHYEGLYLVWGWKLKMYLDALGTIFMIGGQATVVKELVDILRACVYAITDKQCFPTPPNSEDDVHRRIEAVLRCVFPDLRHKPTISKPIKNFIPDTGIPMLQTLIEYKFISTIDDAKRISDEVLADTRAYFTPEWNNFLYVIYETTRIKPEKEWRDLLLTSGITDNTGIVVLSGEPPVSSPKSSPKKVPVGKIARPPSAKG